MTFGEELIQSAKEALAIAEGHAKPAAVFVPETIEVANRAGQQNDDGPRRDGIGKQCDLA